MSNVSVPSPVLTCSLTVENLTGIGTIRKSTTYKNARLLLGRNEFQDILLKLETPKLSLKFPIREINMHKRFLKEGKATIHLKDQQTNLMIANAPPNLLLSLLKILSGKMAKKIDNKEIVSTRQRMLSNLPKSFEEISPMTAKEFESLRQRKGEMGLRERNPNVGIPGSSPVSSKRKFNTFDKDCTQDKPAKAPRFLNPIILNQEQKRVISSVQAGSNVFFTGSAGTGKSFLLRHIVGALPPDSTFVTASTGIAACHIGGTTLHSFAGIGSGSASVEESINLAKRKSFLSQWKACKHLIIDEVSMVHGEYFEKMEAVARRLKGNDKPFGGIQLVLCGDFLQLPPVTQKGAERLFCFQTDAWDRCVALNIELTEVRRQNDPLFINILQNLRIGRCSAEHERILKETIGNVVARDDIKATRLCTHKEDVQHINDVQLGKLAGESKTFHAVDSDPYLQDTLDKATPCPAALTLKVGAQVMLAKNLEVGEGLVNGARGVVTSFKGEKGLPVVRFACGVTREMRHEKWTVKSRGGGGGMTLSRRQVPLKLAWAFSIHKSQGMTLDCVEMSLSKVFETGQAYVALSRAKSLHSLRILDFDPKCIKAHPDVQRFYYNLKKLTTAQRQENITQYF